MTREWRRLAHIREQQERMARLKLATAVGKLREASDVYDVHRQEADSMDRAWEKLLAEPVQASHWAAMAHSGAHQQEALRTAEQHMRRAQTVTEAVAREHQATVVNEEMAQTLVERQLVEERREAWLRLQQLIDEHTAASRDREREIHEFDG